MTTTISGSQITFNDNTTQNTSAYGGGFAMRNRIINGAMVIDQRNAGASVTQSTSVLYTVDRWWIYGSASSKFTLQQQTSVVPTGYTYAIKATSSSAYSVASTNEFDIAQYIEGYNIADLNWGSANAKTVTLSFWVYSSLAGSFGGQIANSNSSRSYPFSYTISSANTWEQKTVTIPGDTSGTWLTTNGAGMLVLFSLGAGTTKSGTANTWAGANYTQPTGSTSVVGTNGATFYITGVQLEKGSTATSFDYRPYSSELAMCQRYYEKSYDYSVVPATTTNVGRWNAGGTATGQTTGYVSGGHVVFQVEKRAIPTVTSYDAAGNSGKCTRFTLGSADSNNQNVVVADVAMNGWFPFADTGGSNNSGCGVHWVASSEL